MGNMRALAMLLIAVGVGYAIYQYSLKKLPATNIALNSKCSSVDDLISTGALKMVRAERSGYAYEVNCLAGANFEVVARHAPAPEGSSIRYPTLAIDTSMQLHEVQ